MELKEQHLSAACPEVLQLWTVDLPCVLYPFLFFLLRAPSNDSATCSKGILYFYLTNH
jgi:hypothetical protein